MPAKRGPFTNRVVLVTGGARGIGRNIAASFGREGSHVVICDIDENAGKKTAAEFCKSGMRVEFVRVDLEERQAPQELVRGVVKRLNKLDVVINNASSCRRTGLLEEDEGTWDGCMSVSLRAAFFISQEAIRAISGRGGGCIVNIGSIAAEVVCNESPVYHIAKAGLVQMTRYLAAHAGKYGVRVNAVLPGFIVQDEHRPRYEGRGNKRYRKISEFCHPSGRVGTSDDVANAVLFLSSPASAFITGQCLCVDGGLTLHEQSSLVFDFDKYAR